MAEIAVIAACLVLNALFAAMEMAFVSVSRNELRSLAKSGSKAAEQLMRMRENPERTLSIIQVGITVVAALAAAVGGAGAAENLEPYFMGELGMSEFSAEMLAIAMAVVPITYLSVVVGELVPKSLALKNPIRIALPSARWLGIADRILNPVVSLLEWSTKLVLSCIETKKIEKESTPDGPNAIEIGKLSPVHQRFMLNMADIETKKISDIFVPWGDVVHVGMDFTLEQVSEMVLKSGHTRLPVLAGGKIEGILHTKEFTVLKETGVGDWQSIIRPAMTVQEFDSALGVLRRLQRQRNHMAVVFSSRSDELLGVVTLEDILEQIVGEIHDEDDDGFVRRRLAEKGRLRAPRRSTESRPDKR